MGATVTLLPTIEKGGAWAGVYLECEATLANFGNTQDCRQMFGLFVAG